MSGRLEATNPPVSVHAGQLGILPANMPSLPDMSELFGYTKKHLDVFAPLPDYGIKCELENQLLGMTARSLLPQIYPDAGVLSVGG
jgi:hypothetical protein